MLAAGNFPHIARYDADILGSSASCLWGWCRWRARWDWRGSASSRSIRTEIVYELPEELQRREKRLAAIQAAKARCQLDPEKTQRGRPMAVDGRPEPAVVLADAGYCNEPDRAVARKLEDDVAFRMLAAGNFPQHRTVCEFRRRHLGEFSELFVGVVQVAREMGLARFGKLSVDGTKVRANASKRKAMSYERMGKEAARLQAEIEALLTKAGMVDAEEDERWGEDFRGDELPEELQRREKRLAAIQAAKARLEAAQRGRDDERGREPGQDRNPRGGRPYKRAYGEPEPKAQSNFTDPESQIMKTSSEGFQQCYNAQMAVDGEHQIIVATQVGPQASDQGQLVGMLDEINETFGVEPAVVLADAGYCNEPDLLELEDRGIDAHVALGREGKSQVAVDPARLPATHRMGEKLASPAGKARYAQRKWLSEAPNGWIKEVL